MSNLSRANLQIVQSKTLTQLVVEKITEAITTGDMPLGEPLSEELLSRTMAVSRTPIREALVLLAARELVQIKPKVGTFVFMPTIAELSQLTKYRQMLELTASERLMETQSKAHFDHIEKAILDLDEGIEKDDWRCCAKADSDIHRAVIAASENKYVIDAYNNVDSRLSAIRSLLLRDHYEGSLDRTKKRTAPEHKQIIKAIRDCDVESMRALTIAHTQNVIPEFERALKTISERNALLDQG